MQEDDFFVAQHTQTPHQQEFATEVLREISSHPARHDALYVHFLMICKKLFSPCTTGKLLALSFDRSKCIFAMRLSRVTLILHNQASIVFVGFDSCPRIGASCKSLDKIGDHAAHGLRANESGSA